MIWTASVLKYAVPTAGEPQNHKKWLELWSGWNCDSNSILEDAISTRDNNDEFRKKITNLFSLFCFKGDKFNGNPLFGVKGKEIQWF